MYEKKVMQNIDEMLEDLERNRFFGSVELKLEAGRVVLLRKTETIKPEPKNHRNNRGELDEQHS